jgi:hypothetical protein
VFWALDPRTAVTLPLAARGRTLGALSVYRSAGRPAADEDDVATAQEVAARVALALDNARLYEQQRRLAEGLQRSLLSAPPAPDAAEIVVRYRPAVEVAQVGGDWYDAFVQPSGDDDARHRRRRRARHRGRRGDGPAARAAARHRLPRRRRARRRCSATSTRRAGARHAHDGDRGRWPGSSRPPSSGTPG